ncbi:Conserved hypothetical protein [Prochlorococcus marinus str. MIT 9313]|uniref:Uncharacterized protein n=1 Tax=Prochlorococcus marinus (strain MIT 9313) TaxID=74547 RepID=B9ESK1_PROMM|nr:Conserved hypothetical protein [Prochlorococcus marinus str. MIT 9313]
MVLHVLSKALSPKTAAGPKCKKKLPEGQLISAPGEIRTPDPLIRSQML